MSKRPPDRRPSAPRSSASPEGGPSPGRTAPEAAREPGRKRRRRRSDGERSHQEILLAAARLASVEGLDGLSIGALAEHVGLSKSGLFAHFRSKEELQLETIATASAIFREEVVKPALAVEGVARVRALVAGFLAHVRRRTFPGGCVFASVAAEVDGHPGALRDRIAAMNREWSALFRASLEEAQRRGELEPGTDAAQVAFEVQSMLQGGHATFLLLGEEAALDRARRGTEAVLALYGAKAQGAASKEAD
jgi:AcrR family transcriptional regulator